MINASHYNALNLINEKWIWAYAIIKRVKAKIIPGEVIKDCIRY